MSIQIYTDGSTRNNGTFNAVGAHGFLVLQDGEIINRQAAASVNTTNQREEMLAILMALRQFKARDYGMVEIYTDSAYIINCYEQHWYYGWLANGWLNSKKEPVKNRDLWEELLPYFRNSSYVFKKVKGHADDQYNNIVDNMVQLLSRSKQNEISNS